MREKCIICGSEKLEKYSASICPFLKHRMFSDQAVNEVLYSCPDCGFKYSAFRPTDEEAEKYSQNYMQDEYVIERDSFEPGFLSWRKQYDLEDGFEKEKKSRKGLMKDLFRKYMFFDKIQTVLDYGGANGEFILDDFTNAKKYVYDIDAENLIINANRIKKQDLQTFQWDLIQCNHVLEHVANPVNLIEEIIKISNDGTFIYLEVPYESYFEDLIKTGQPVPIHEHINFFTEETFFKIFSRPDFIILNCEVIEQKDLFGQNKIVRCLVRKINNVCLGLLYQEIKRQKDKEELLIKKISEQELKNKIMFKYFYLIMKNRSLYLLKIRFLSHVTFGKTRIHYKNKWKEIKNTIGLFKEVIK